MKSKVASVSSRMAGTTLVMVLCILAMPFLVSLTKPPLICSMIRVYKAREELFNMPSEDNTLIQHYTKCTEVEA